MGVMRSGYKEPVRAWSLILLGFFGTLGGALLGLATNCVNGWLSPSYFLQFMGSFWWPPPPEVIWRWSMAQGVFEGGLFGLILSAIFVTVAGVITEGTCPFGFGLKHLGGILAGAFACWLLGGILGVAVALLSPEYFSRASVGTGPGLLAYAWVGGSILGVEWGGAACTLLGLMLLRANWRRRGESLPAVETPPPARNESDHIQSGR
jgi:hypothetical protein